MRVSSTHFQALAVPLCVYACMHVISTNLNAHMHIVRGTHGSIQALAVPYLVVWGTLPQLGHSAQACSRVWRSMYPASATLALMAVLSKRAMRALLQMHTALRDSLYLVGRRLHNMP